MTELETPVARQFLQELTEAFSRLDENDALLTRDACLGMIRAYFHGKERGHHEGMREVIGAIGSRDDRSR